MTDVGLLVLAAGRGSRLGPLSADRPKGLTPFLGRPLIEWQIACYDMLEVSSRAIVTGYRGNMYDGLDFATFRNPDWETTNMVRSALHARSFLEMHDELVIAYSDIIFEPRVLSLLLETKGDVVVSADRAWLDLWSMRFEDPLSDAESFTMDQDERILDIGHPAKRYDDIQAQYIGLIKLSRTGVREFLDMTDQAPEAGAWIGGRTLDKSYMTDAIQGLIQRGGDVRASLHDGGWLEFDLASDLDAYGAAAASPPNGRFFRPETCLREP